MRPPCCCSCLACPQKLWLLGQGTQQVPRLCKPQVLLPWLGHWLLWQGTTVTTVVVVQLHWGCGAHCQPVSQAPCLHQLAWDQAALAHLGSQDQ
jgi:hypothetical protein